MKPVGSACAKILDFWRGGQDNLTLDEVEKIGI